MDPEQYWTWVVNGFRGIFGLLVDLPPTKNPETIKHLKKAHQRLGEIIKCCCPEQTSNGS